MSRNGIKRRIYDEIKVDGVPLLTMFDTGAWNTYISESAVERSGLEPRKVKRPFWTSLGGRKHLIKEEVTVNGTIHRLPLCIQLFVIDEIGKMHVGREIKDIEILFGLPLLEVWGIEFDIKRKKLDLSGFSKEFIEF